VNSSSAFKLLLTAVLLVSISWKIAIASKHESSPTDGLVQFLERHQFEVVLTEQLVAGMPIIEAKTASCHLKVARLAPDGSDQDLLRHLTLDTDQLFFVFAGRVYTQQPVFWTQINYLWSRRLHELGLTEHIRYAFAIIADSSCNAEQLPWTELEKIS
jgi:hypothetical protein